MIHQAVFCADAIYPLFMNLSYIESHVVVMMIWWGGKWSWIILKHYSGRDKIFPVLWSTLGLSNLIAYTQPKLDFLKSCQNETWSVENMLSHSVNNPWINYLTTMWEHLIILTHEKRYTDIGRKMRKVLCGTIFGRGQLQKSLSKSNRDLFAGSDRTHFAKPVPCPRAGQFAIFSLCHEYKMSATTNGFLFLKINGREGSKWLLSII